MKFTFWLCLTSLILISCDSKRVFENDIDFEDRSWRINQPGEFEFQIKDEKKKYNLLMNIRNSLDYPYSRLFVNYKLSSGQETVSKELIAVYLFDQKTGKPFGTSGIGDIYDHRFSVLKNFTFQKPGLYKVSFQQFMRKDTIPGILAVGLRVETAE